MALPLDSLKKHLHASSDTVYVAFRMVLGLLFAFHGAQKILGIMTTSTPALLSQMWVGGLIELVAGVLIAAGLFTQLAAFLASGTMAVAYLQFHWRLHFDRNILPAINHGELSVVYCFTFLYVATVGDGKWSLGALFGKTR